MAKKEQTADGSTWLVQNVQLIGFPVETWIEKDQSWWKELVGKDPEQVSRTGFEHEWKGPWNSGSLHLKVDPARVIWLWGPSTPTSPDFIPNLGNAEKTLKSFVGSLKKWLSSAPDLKRLALLALVVQRAENDADAISRLKNYVPKLDVDSTCRDVLFKVNRRRKSATLPSVELNRLTTWQPMRFVLTVNRASALGLPSEEQMSFERFALTLATDINTDQALATPLPRNQLGQLLDELLTLIIEVTSKGDIP